MRGDQAPLDSLLTDTIYVQSGSVVDDFDIDLAAFMESPQLQNASEVFPGQLPGFRGLDSVIDGIPDQMCKRVFNCLDDRAIEFGVLPFHFQANVFSAAERQIADRPGELVPDIADWLHSRLHDVFLQFGRDKVHALGDSLKASILSTI